jgi:hypothetical protein
VTLARQIQILRIVQVAFLRQLPRHGRAPAGKAFPPLPAAPDVANGLHEVITRPLDLAGIDEQHREDLARAVLKDVGDEPGELALLQMALWRTWSEAPGAATTVSPRATATGG